MLYLNAQNNKSILLNSMDMNGSKGFCSMEKLSMPMGLIDIHMMSGNKDWNCMTKERYRSSSVPMENIQNKPMVMNSQQLVLMEQSLNRR